MASQTRLFRGSVSLCSWSEYPGHAEAEVADGGWEWKTSEIHKPTWLNCLNVMWMAVLSPYPYAVVLMPVAALVGSGVYVLGINLSAIAIAPSILSLLNRKSPWIAAVLVRIFRS